MRKYLQLNSDDIQKIVADHYEVKTDAVKIIPYHECVGYGMGKHYESRVKAEVELENDSEN